MNSMKEQYHSIQKVPEAKKTYYEITELINDVLDYLSISTYSHKTNLFTTKAMPSYILVMLMPLSYGMLINFISNNLPACLSQLRTLLESLIRCAYVDLNDSSQDGFDLKIQKIEKMKFGELSTRILSRNDAVKANTLWKHLSNFWVHPTGLMLKIVDHLIKHNTLPSFGLMIPVPYSVDEKQYILETYRSVKKFRRLLNTTIRKWAKRHKIPVRLYTS